MAEVKIELLDEVSYESMSISLDWDCTREEAERMMREGPSQELVRAVLDGLSVILVSVGDEHSPYKGEEVR